MERSTSGHWMQPPPPPPPSSAPPSGPTVQPPPPPPRPSVRGSPVSGPAAVVQCCEDACRIGVTVCGPCRGRVIPWDSLAPVSGLAQEVVRLADALNCLPGMRIPECIVHPSGHGLAYAARHDPRVGRGDDREADASNRAGSALMLAVLLPHVYGVPWAGPLRVCGWPPPESLTSISLSPQSSQGADNHRQNVWEALLNHWQGDREMEELRDLLQSTLLTFRTGVDLLVGSDEPIWRLPRIVLQSTVTPALGRRQ